MIDGSGGQAAHEPSSRRQAPGDHRSHEDIQLS